MVRRSASDDAARQRDLRRGEIPHGARESSVAMRVHVRTIGAMSQDARRVKTSHGDLTLEEIAELLPGTGEIM